MRSPRDYTDEEKKIAGTFDPWPDVREGLRLFVGTEYIIEKVKIERLLIDADALLVVASYAEHDEACAIEGDGTDEIDAEFCTCGYVKARASLSEQLK